MVNPNKELPVWNNAAAGMWQQYLSSHIGSAGLERLATLRPALAAGTLEQAALAGALAKGYELCLANLMALTVSDEALKPTQSEINFPPLDDDRAWPEEQKPQQ